MTRRRIKQLLLLLGVLTLTTSGLVAWHLRPRQQEFYTDSRTIKTPQQGIVARKILWEPPARLADGLNTPQDDAEPTISNDGKTLLFVRGKAGQNADIYACTLTQNAWSKPLPLARVNTPYDELGPTLAADGKTLYFYSDRLGSVGGYDLWVARRSGNEWQPAEHLGPAVNSPADDYGPALAPDGNRLYFSSNRPHPAKAESSESQTTSKPTAPESQHQDYDLYVCTLTNGQPGPATPIESLNTPYDECAPAVSPFGDFLYFASNRPGGFGAMDLYRARRLQAGPGPATNLGQAINTAANELDPTLSIGGYALHFSSDRNAPRAKAGPANTPPKSDYDIYHSTSREVFKKVETTWSRIDWATIWKQIGPNLMWALLSLILILLFFALIQNYKDKKLGLLTRCLLVSLIAHLLLMLLFNVVEVSTTLAGAIRGRSKIQVSLLSEAAADEIANQIRGNLTEVSAPKAMDPPSERSDVAPEFSRHQPTATLDVEQVQFDPTERPTVQPIAEDSPTQQPNEPAIAQVVDAQTEPVAAPPMMDPAVPSAAKPDIARESAAPELPDPAQTTLQKTTFSMAPTTQPADWPPETLLDPAPHEADHPTETPLALVDAGSLRDTEPPTTNMAAAAQQITESIPPSRLELTAPASAAAVDVAESDSPTPPKLEQSIASRAATPATATQTSPAQHDELIAPVESTAAQAEQLPLAALQAAQIHDANPSDMPRTTPSPAAPSPRTVQAAVSELPSPQDGIAKVSEPDEAQPIVALASAQQTRAGTSPNADALSAPTPSSLFARMDPAATDLGAPEPSHSDAPAPQPIEAMPQTASANKLGRQAPTIAAPPLRDIALPADEAVAENQEPPSPENSNVPLIAPHLLRAETNPRPDPDRSPDRSKMFVLPPEESAHVSTPPDVLTDPPQAEDARIAEHTRRAKAPPAQTALTNSRPELALNIPTDTETPPQAAPPADTHGVIEGRVTDARTHAALAGAMIRLVLSHDEDVVAMTDHNGRYVMAVPQAPDFFALSASKTGYLPGTANIRLAAIARKPAMVNFTLHPITESIIALEDEPDVHHLGNDRFEGRINSQFQKQSEGRRYRATFHLTQAQIDAQYTHAEIHLMAKGVQCPHQIRINGHLLRKRLDHSPRRGGFGRFKAPFRTSWLKPGKNRFKITAQSCRGDLDDFEFVNVQIKLTP